MAVIGGHDEGSVNEEHGMSIEQWVAFALAALIILGLPGPANLAASSYALGRNRLATIAAIFGSALGATATMAAALFGLIALADLSPGAFSTVQWISGVYIVVMLIRLIRGPVITGPLADNDNLPKRNPAQVFVHAAAAIAVDPKTIVLSTGLFAQLVDALNPTLENIAVISEIFLSTAIATFGSYALFARKIRGEIRKAYVRIPTRKSKGKTRIGGAKVAFGYRRLAA